MKRERSPAASCPLWPALVDGDSVQSTGRVFHPGLACPRALGKQLLQPIGQLQAEAGLGARRARGVESECTGQAGGTASRGRQSSSISHLQPVRGIHCTDPMARVGWEAQQ